MSRPKNVLPLGPLSAKSAELPHYFPRIRFQQPSLGRICGATSTAPLKMEEVWTAALRPGALDFLKYPSHGTGC